MFRGNGIRDGAQELGKVFRPFGTLGKILTPDTRILPDKDNLMYATAYQIPDFSQDRFGIAGMIAASNVGNHAEATESVASV